jgi:hypothetical protein
VAGKLLPKSFAHALIQEIKPFKYLPFSILGRSFPECLKREPLKVLTSVGH